ncbi:hypothetical protein [Pyrococcus sp. ST04]|uniref:hypothetical protein n=1 Tax=Pyrococcus sp. ST04 TaxID=1183377 RepID=UPI0002605903|nr:hypothetical protein [Pyrococcus sp. ST04]AFK21684.1 hypothetical protein Py04_0078 [Pyrococcus sp. ST04]
MAKISHALSIDYKKLENLRKYLESLKSHDISGRISEAEKKKFGNVENQLVQFDNVRISDIKRARSPKDVIAKFGEGVDFSMKVIEGELNEFSKEIMIVRDNISGELQGVITALRELGEEMHKIERWESYLDRVARHTFSLKEELRPIEDLFEEFEEKVKRVEHKIKEKRSVKELETVRKHVDSLRKIVESIENATEGFGDIEEEIEKVLRKLKDTNINKLVWQANDTKSDVEKILGDLYTLTVNYIKQLKMIRAKIHYEIIQASNEALKVEVYVSRIKRMREAMAKRLNNLTKRIRR